MLEKTNLPSWLEGLDVPGNLAFVIPAGAIVVAAAVAYAAHKLASQFASRVSSRILAKRIPHWQVPLEHSRLLARLTHLIPLVILNAVLEAFFDAGSLGRDLGRATAHLYLLAIVAGTVISLADLASDIAGKSRWAKSFPITGFAQALKLITVLLAAISALATLLGKSPAYLLSGLGALTAILMLVFKDTILGFTAGIVLSTNRMVSIGDWIEMPSMDADGDVIEVSLTTVKVRNWDKTITSIPAYALVSQSFRNWQGMFETGGRRIKRSIILDMQNFRFATAAQIERWRKIALLKSYLHSKLTEIERANHQLEGDLSVLANGRRLTNIGTFRAYCQAYLRTHPGVHKGLITMVRQLAPTETGLPLEIYAFASDTAWAAYEGIQADIFDHLLAILPEFGLEVYQRESDAASRPLVPLQQNSQMPKPQMPNPALEEKA